MSRRPEETIAQWSARATGQYRDAWEAFGVQRRRMSQIGFVGPGLYPLLDDGYDGALDALDDADNERNEAAIALDRQMHPAVSD